MVGPGDVDEDLQPEVAEECAKYGEVERCLIFEVIIIMCKNIIMLVHPPPSLSCLFIDSSWSS